MVGDLYPVIFSPVALQNRVVDHAQRQRWPVVWLVVEIRRDLFLAEDRSDYVFLRERRYLFFGLKTKKIIILLVSSDLNA